MSNSGKVKCTCGWSWNKSDSSKKDMYVCHECGRDNSNNMENGGWLDSYADGGTMQEHQENYNDPQVSLPEGFVGMGNNTKGRDYSPAWGGQFQDGGAIYVSSENDPRYKSYADSLYNYNLGNKLKGIAKSIPSLVEIKKGSPYDKALQKTLMKSKNRGLVDNTKNPNSKSIDPRVQALMKEYQKKGNKGIKPIRYNSFIDDPDNAAMDIITGRGLTDLIGLTKERSKGYNLPEWKKPKQKVVVDSKTKQNPKPEAQANKKLNKDPKKEVVQPDLPRVEAINLPPMQQLQSMSAPTTSDVVREPKSYNISRKTYTMKGLDDYYTRDEEGVDYERAMLIKAASDAHNRDILKRYGPQNEYRTPKSAADAAERLKQLRSEFEMTPNYQMGGSVYPVNYVPEAQMGASIPGAVGFSYARTQSPAPSNGKYAKKTLPSAQDGVQTWKKQRELVKKENLKKLEQLLKNPPVYKKKTFEEELKESLKERPRTVVKESTAVRNYNNADKHSNAARNKTDKEIADERKAIRAKADANVLNQYSTKALNTDNWTRQNLSDATLGLESKFRVSDEPNFFDDYLNPANMIGNMASNLGQAPLQAQQQDSYMPYVTSILTPLAVGAFAGLGTKSTGQFVNNLVNPLAGTRDVFNNILPPRNILVDEKYMGNSAMLNAINDVKSTTLPSKTKLNELREAVEHDELWKYSDINPADEIERLKKAAKTEADVAYINSLEKQYDKNVSWHDASRNRANPVFVTGQSIEDLVNPAFKNPEGDQWFAMQPYKYTTPKGKNLGYIADEADYIHSTKYRLPGNRWDTEAMLRDMGESANESFNSMYKPFNVNMKDIPMNKNGGVTKDDMGYWNPDNWGSPVEIGSTDITMEGVYEPLLGVSDTGDTKLMKPGKNYKFKGKKVTEYPMANNGLRQEQKGLVNLDNLLNFTNYNTKQPGGWLDKY